MNTNVDLDFAHCTNLSRAFATNEIPLPPNKFSIKTVLQDKLRSQTIVQSIAEAAAADAKAKSNSDPLKENLDTFVDTIWVLHFNSESGESLHSARKTALNTSIAASSTASLATNSAAASTSTSAAASGTAAAVSSARRPAISEFALYIFPDDLPEKLREGRTSLTALKNQLQRDLNSPDFQERGDKFIRNVVTRALRQMASARENRAAKINEIKNVLNEISIKNKFNDALLKAKINELESNSYQIIAASFRELYIGENSSTRFENGVISNICTTQLRQDKSVAEIKSYIRNYFSAWGVIITNERIAPLLGQAQRESERNENQAHLQNVYQLLGLFMEQDAGDDFAQTFAESRAEAEKRATAEAISSALKQADVIPAQLQKLHDLAVDCMRYASDETLKIVDPKTKKIKYDTREAFVEENAYATAQNLAVLYVVKNTTLNATNLTVSYNEFRSNKKNQFTSKPQTLTLQVNENVDGHPFYKDIFQTRTEYATLSEEQKRLLEEAIKSETAPAEDPLKSLFNKIVALSNSKLFRHEQKPDGEDRKFKGPTIRVAMMLPNKETFTITKN